MFGFLKSMLAGIAAHRHRVFFAVSLFCMVGATIGFIVVAHETKITGFSAPSASQYETREETNHQLTIWVVVTMAVAFLTGLYGVVFGDRGWTMASMVSLFVLLGIVHVHWNAEFIRIAAGVAAFFGIGALVCGNVYEEALGDEKQGACCGGNPSDCFDLPDQDYQSLRRLAVAPLLLTAAIAVVVIGLGSSLHGNSNTSANTELWSLRFTLVIAAAFIAFGALLALRALLLAAGSRLILYSAFTWCILGMMFAASVVFQLGAANDLFGTVCALPASVRPTDCSMQRRIVTALYAFVFPLIVFAGTSAYLALRIGEKLQSDNTRMDIGLGSNIVLRLSLRGLAARCMVATIVVQAGCAVGLLAVATSQGNGSGIGNSAGGVEYLASQFNYTVCFLALGAVIVGLTALLFESRALLLLYVTLSLYTGMCAQIVCKRGGVQLLVGGAASGFTATIKAQAQNSATYTAVLFATAALAATAALIVSESLQDDKKASASDDAEDSEQDSASESRVGSSSSGSSSP